MDTTGTVNKEIFSPGELAAFLGISRTSAYKLLQTGEIPSCRIGRLRRVRKQDVDAYLEKQILEQ